MMRNGIFVRRVETLGNVGVSGAAISGNGGVRGVVDRLRGGPTSLLASPISIVLPVPPLTSPARLPTPLGLPVTPPRRPAVLGAGRLAADLGTVVLPALARRADHHLPAASLAREHSPSLAHPTLARAGWT